MSDTTIIDIDLACDIKNDIILNSDVIVPDIALKDKILKTDNNLLMRVVKVIGSKKRIISADVVDLLYLDNNLISKK